MWQVAKWNTRTTQLIERYNQVDPDEYKQLTEERETRKQEVIELKAQVESLRYAVCVCVSVCLSVWLFVCLSGWLFVKHFNVASYIVLLI